MKHLIAFLLMLITHLGFANMYSPVSEGTLSSSAFSSREIDIVKETIAIRIDKDFKTASYKIEYLINAETEGGQIPLLFLAKDYKGDFKVFVDGYEVKLIEVPSYLKTTLGSPFKNFSNSFADDWVSIQWNSRSGVGYRLSDLKYFETSLTIGKHRINVEYIANVWRDISNWVTEYSFRYSLSPARYWKSFGSLEITLDAASFNGKLSTNLGQPQTGKPDSIAAWTFQNLPSDFIKITYVPEVSQLAQQLIRIGTEKLTYIFAFIIAVLHLVFIILFRKRYPQKKYSWVLIMGSIIIPYLIIWFYVYSYQLIDDSIGAEAGRYHGYLFLNMVMYPIITPVYWLVMWLLEKALRQKFIRA